MEVREHSSEALLLVLVICGLSNNLLFPVGTHGRGVPRLVLRLASSFLGPVVLGARS